MIKTQAYIHYDRGRYQTWAIYFKAAAGIWTKLESLYMTKSFANHLYMKQSLYFYKISEDISALEQMDDFNEILDDLEHIDVKTNDEDKAIMLLNSLPKSHDHLKDAMMYGRDGTIFLEEVQSALRAKELQKVNEGKHEPAREGLNIKHKFTKDRKQKRFPYDSKKLDHARNKDSEEKETRKCHFYKKQGHLKKDCYAYKNKQK